MDPSSQDWPRCACGCGEAVPARKANDHKRGFVKGEPCRFVANHSNRLRWKLPHGGLNECSKCAETKPVGEFHADSHRPSGLTPWCKSCVAENAANWYQRNRERVAENGRKYHAANPDYQRQNMARWRENNRDHYLVQARRYVANRVARKLAQFVEEIDHMTVFQRDKGICGICGESVDSADFHVDHIFPLARGGEHSYANVQLAHPRCNLQKNATLPEAA